MWVVARKGARAALAAITRGLARGGGPLYITWGNAAFVPFLDNWLAHVKRFDPSLARVVVGAMDARTRAWAARRPERLKVYDMGIAARHSVSRSTFTHWAGSEWWHRPAQGPSAPQIGSQRLCS